jgi:formylglycine-generating enzyme
MRRPAGSQQREYPWGDAAPGTANQLAIYGCYYPLGSPGDSPLSCTGVENIAPVGSATLEACRWGQLDLVGEVFGWNLDWYAPYVDPCADCANLTTASDRVGRGGSLALASFLLPPSRSSATPATRGYIIGLRCARTP